ncbi:MAG: hypothetical protein J0L92_21210 [Deltaproteobacteria bacterium]|nr:hypothetical protein [Deltaproteobacteria bacterium]
MKKLFVISMLMLSSLAVLPTSALAEEPAPVRLGEVRIRGRVPTPVRVFVARSHATADRAEPRASFTREIVSSTSRSPF